MTQTLNHGRAAQHRIPAARPRLVTGRFAAALLASFGALASLYLLLSVTPMYAVSGVWLAQNTTTTASFRS